MQAVLFKESYRYIDMPHINDTPTIRTSGFTLPMLRLLSFKAQGGKDFRKPSKPCHVGIHWIALAEYSHMSTHLPEFQSFFSFFNHFVLAKLVTSRIRVNGWHNIIF